MNPTKMKPEDRPTPETDARVRLENPIGAPGNTALISTDFAIKLERERDEARRQRDRLLEALEDTKPLLIGIESDPGEPSHRRERAKRLLRTFESAIAEVKGAK